MLCLHSIRQTYCIQYSMHAMLIFIVLNIATKKIINIRDRFILSNDNTQTAASESLKNHTKIQNVFNKYILCNVYFTEMFLNLFLKPSTICVEECTSVDKLNAHNLLTIPIKKIIYIYTQIFPTGTGVFYCSCHNDS